MTEQDIQNIIDILDGKVEDAAAAVRDVSALVDEGDVGVGQEALGASSGLGAEGHAADNKDIEGHR